MSTEAKQVISAYYTFHREQEDRSVALTTVRLLESARRLSEGHARLMYRSVVTLQDAITAVAVLEVSMQSSKIVQVPNSLNTTSPDDPMEEYRNQGFAILSKFNLLSLWDEELARLRANRIN
jgi:DNA helicase MCM9